MFHPDELNLSLHRMFVRLILRLRGQQSLRPAVTIGNRKYILRPVLVFTSDSD